MSNGLPEVEKVSFFFIIIVKKSLLTCKYYLVKRYIRKGIPPELRGQVRFLKKKNWGRIREHVFFLINKFRHGYITVELKREWNQIKDYILI